MLALFPSLLTVTLPLLIFGYMEHEAKGLGIIIRTEKARDADRSETLFSPSLGLIRVMSYGARKSIRSVKAPLYTEGTFSLEKSIRSGRWSIRDIDVISIHSALHEDLGKNMAAALFSDLVITSRSADPQLYRLYVTALDLLEDYDEETVAIAFIVHFLSQEGLSGDYLTCPVCQRPYRDDEILGFSLVEGVPVCSECDTMDSSLILPPNARRFVRRTLELELDDAVCLSVSSMQRHRIFRYFLRLLRLSFPGKLRSIESGIWDMHKEEVADEN